MKRSSLFLGAFLCLFLCGTALTLSAGKMSVQQTFSGILQEILQKLENFVKGNPEEKVYLHFDKPFYKPGETIWFAAYVRDGKDLKAAHESDIVNVELINPRGGVEKAIKLLTKDGVAQGDFALDAAAPGGMYVVKAYTNWMKNDPNPAFFEKEIQVQAVVLPRLKMKLDFPKDAYGPGAEVIADLSLNTNENQPLANYAFNYVVNLAGNSFTKGKATTNAAGEAVVKFNLPEDLETNDALLNIMIDYQGQNESVSRSVPIVLNDIRVEFFPEGGDMVANQPARVAFRALNEFGKPADIEGYVSDKDGNIVANTASYHKGMGAFDLKPKEDETYTFHITQPVGVKQTYTLPDALPRGYVLRVEKAEAENLFLKVYSDVAEDLHLVATVHGQNVFATTIPAKVGENFLSIPTKDMPIGIAQITLFDAKGIARAERLAFVNKQKQLKIDISTDKDKYLPREKVTMTVKVRDERGMPMPANLSLSVVNDQLLSFADDKSSNILSWLLVEGELKGKVDEPNFYFDPKEEKRDLALEYLLMTAGWRRYSWKEVLSGQTQVASYAAERAEFGGVIYDNMTGSPKKGVKAVIESTKQTVTTGEDGTYRFRGVEIDPVNGTKIVFTADKGATQSTLVTSYSLGYTVWMGNEMPRPRPMMLEGMVKNVPPKAIAAKPGAKRDRVQIKAQEEIEQEDVMVNEDFGAADDVAFAAPPAPPVEALKMKEDAKPAAPLKDEAKVEKTVVATTKSEVAAVMQQEVVDLRKPAVEGKKKPNIEQNKNLADQEDGDEWAVDWDGVGGEAQVAQALQFYRAKQFASPVYSTGIENVGYKRSDFRSTLYWNGNVVVDRSGKTVLSFYASDEVTSFRITAEGIATDGMPGRAEKTFFTQLPFSLSAKIPVEVVTEDVVRIPLTLVNNTDKTLTGPLDLIAPLGLEYQGTLPGTVSIDAKSAKTIYLPYLVKSLKGNGKFEASFRGFGFNDAVAQDIKILAKGFPVKLAGSSSEGDKTYPFDIQNAVNGSLSISLTAYPSTVGEVMKGLEGMLQEPYGCFEQTSSSTYPNILVINYLNETGQANKEVKDKALGLIEKGYKRLTSYESKSGGFEWFGGDPAHEGLTAYGLMEFMDMAKVWDGVDNKMVKRTADWLMKRRDGKGGFERNPRALHEFGLTDEQSMSTYIVWALSENKMEGLEKELNQAYKAAMDNKNPYQLGLVANALYNYDRDADAQKALNTLIAVQNEKGAWATKENTRSAPGSGGQAYEIETAALGLLAMMKGNNPNMANIRKVATFIQGSRNSYGSFGSTNSTVLALKSLIQFAQFSKRTDEDGKIEVYANGKKVAEKSYEKGLQEPIVLDGLEAFAGNGAQEFRVKYVGVKNPLPYTLSVTYNTALPQSQKDCAVKLDAKLASSNIKVGETVRLSAKLSNVQNEGQPMTMAIIGLPAGLSPQPWQLKELKEKNVFDFYEVIGNNVVLYYRQMKPSESRDINLDLKADIPGTFEAPASSAYLYYTNELKHWSALPKVTITQ